MASHHLWLAVLNDPDDHQIELMRKVPRSAERVLAKRGIAGRPLLTWTGRCIRGAGGIGVGGCTGSHRRLGRSSSRAVGQPIAVFLSYAAPRAGKRAARLPQIRKEMLVIFSAGGIDKIFD